MTGTDRPFKAMIWYMKKINIKNKGKVNIIMASAWTLAIFNLISKNLLRNIIIISI